MRGPTPSGMTFLTSKRERILRSHIVIIADTLEASEELFPSVYSCDLRIGN